MADWRENNQGKAKPTRPKAPKKRAQPKPQSGGGWRKRPAADTSSSGGAGAGRSWTGAAVEAEAMSMPVMRRWLFVGLLLSLALLLTGWFLYYVFLQPPKLPLFVFSVGEYSAPELLENPFGSVQRQRLQDSNTTNIQVHLEVDSQQNDLALSALNSDNWLAEFDQINSKVIDGGGPDSKVVAFYVSAFANISDRQQLRIYSQGSSPFERAEPPLPGIQLQDLLTNLSKSVNPSAIAWVILDLQLPPVTSNLGDLDAPWRKATERALAEVDERLRKRLLITLPCDDGQQNWLAPEVSSSFFGHHFRQLLEGKFANLGMLRESLTIDQFREELAGRVTTATSNHRYALQTPVWLPEPTLARVSGIEVVTISDADAIVAPQPTRVDSTQLNQLDEMWAQLTTAEYQRGYRWDPLGYARVESQLLALENVALYQPGYFTKALGDATLAWRAMHRPNVTREVSLIEDRLREEYFHGSKTRRQYDAIDQLAAELAAALDSSAEAVPSFWQTPSTPDSPPAGPPPAEEQLSVADRPTLVWQFLLRCAQSSDRKLWERVFRSANLRRALEYADQSEPTWLEMSIVNRLASDIDWDVNNRDLVKSCSEAIVLFQRLQAVASRPDPELSWWLRKQLPDIERQFLRGFDWLLAGKTDQAMREFEPVALQLTTLEQEISELALVSGSVQSALHIIPHLLAWLEKEYQFAPDQDLPQLKKQLEELGQMVNLTQEIYRHLKSTHERLDEEMFEKRRQLDAGQATLMAAARAYLDSKTSSKVTGAAAGSPLTFRRERILLNCPTPILAVAQRRRLHERILAFLGNTLEERRDQSEESRPPQRSAREAADLFLGAIETERDQWKALATGDFRNNLESTLRGSAVPDVSNAPSLRAELLDTEYWQRAYAVVFGSYPSLHKRLSNEDRAGSSWPWSAAWQRWSLSATNHRLLQIERLAEAGWGNGVISDNWIPEKFFFGQLARRYQDIVTNFSVLEPSGQLARRFEVHMQRAVESKAEKIKSLRAQFGEPNQSITKQGQKRAPVSVAGETWNAVADLYMGKQRDPTAWRIQTSWAAPLDQRPSTNLTFEAKYWLDSAGPPLGTLSVRGNKRIEPVVWRQVEDKQQWVELSLVRNPAMDATIRVRPPKDLPKLTVLMLVDCSKSTNTSISAITEEGSRSQVKVFDLVKSNALSVLGWLEDIHGKEADIRLGLIPFGLATKDISERLKPFLLMRADDYYRSRNIDRLEGRWPLDVEDAIEGLTPSGDTPLYDAIAMACDIATKQNDHQCLIYVFSDGVHYINGNTKAKQEQRARSKSAADIKRLVGANDKIRLNIFHLDHFETWIQGQDQQERWREVFSKGKLQLEGLKSIGPQYGYYRSDEAAKLKAESEKTIPHSTVRVKSVKQATDRPFHSPPTRLGEPIQVPMVHLPAQLQLAIEGPFGAATTELESYGGEDLKLDFDPGTRPLKFEPFISSGKRTADNVVGAKLSSVLHVKMLDERLERHGTLAFELNFLNRDNSRFTARPRFLVAEISRSDDPRSGTYVLADSRFQVGSHYPEAHQSPFPWPRNRPAARIRVWAANVIPKKPYVQMISIEPGQSQKLALDNADISLDHTGDMLIAQVDYQNKAPAADERVAILGPNWDRTTRRFDVDTNAERHEITLIPTAHNATYQLQVTSIGALEEAARANEVTQFDIERFELQN